MIRFSRSSRGNRDIFRRTVCYGVISPTPESGILSASIALANYFSSVRGLKTGLAVVGDDGGVSHMLRKADCVSVDPAGYSDGVMTWYILDTAEDIEKLKNGDMERIVVVMRGDRGTYSVADLLRADRLLAFVSTYPWRYQYAREFLHSTIICNEGLRQRFGNTVYVPEGTDEGNSFLAEEFRISVTDIRGIRMISDPYQLNRSDIKTLSVF